MVPLLTIGRTGHAKVFNTQKHIRLHTHRTADRNCNHRYPYRPKEWFCVTLEAIQDSVEKIKDGTITDYQFNIKTGLMEKH
jgi:hypothetical protein